MTKICPNCGTENQDSSEFCQNCGNKMEGTVKTSQPNKSTKTGFMGWWDKQTKGIKALSIIGVCCLGLIVIAAIGGMISPDKTSTNVSTPSSTNTTTPAVASNVFENKYYKFTTPPGTTVRDSDGNLAPAGGDNENLQLWDSSINSKDIDGKEIGYADIGTGRMDGNASNGLIEMGYTSSKTIAGYQSYYLLTPASGAQESFGDYTLILGESKVQPGRTDIFSIEFDSDTADKIKIVTDSLVIKSSVIK